MGRKSIKENKSIYQLCREEQSLTRDDAAELLGFLSADRIEKIESGKTAPRPEEVLRMAECYHHPELCNLFCARECPIGRKTVPEVERKELSQITLEMINTINALNREKDRLVEITVDGRITADELRDFREIRRRLEEMNAAIDSLSLWVEENGAGE